MIVAMIVFFFFCLLLICFCVVVCSGGGRGGGGLSIGVQVYCVMLFISYQSFVSLLSFVCSLQCHLFLFVCVCFLASEFCDHHLPL